MTFKGLVKEDNEKLRGRLYNWKFEQAEKYTEAESDQVKHMVEDLAQLLGNSGWVPGQIGNVISGLVYCLIGDQGYV